MGNYDDYSLEEAENAAVNKSNKMKRAAVIGAAALGGGTAAFGTEHIINADGADDLTDVNANDLMSGADAAAIDDSATNVDEEQPQVVTPQPEYHQAVPEQHIHIHNHPVEEMEIEEPIEDPMDEPVLEVNESAIIFDEDGNIISQVDSGTLDGDEFMVIDSDLNGKGDILAYDLNGNHIIEENEIIELDNKSYSMGQGENTAFYQLDEDPETDEIEVTPIGKVDDDDISDIENDYRDEKTGEEYHDDLAENNIDYRNKESAEQYTADLDEKYEDDDVIDSGLPDDSNVIDDPIDINYGYNPDYDHAYNDGADAVDDASQYDIV